MVKESSYKLKLLLSVKVGSLLLFRVHELLLPVSCSVSYSRGAHVLWSLNTGHGPQRPGSGSWESLEGSMEVVGGAYVRTLAHLLAIEV